MTPTVKVRFWRKLLATEFAEYPCSAIANLRDQESTGREAMSADDAASMVVDQFVAGRLSAPRACRIQPLIRLIQLPDAVLSRGFVAAHGAMRRLRMEVRTLSANEPWLYHRIP
jgi:hypothetical protein